MTAVAVIVGIGQLAAGDDGVGLAVARTLAARGLAVRDSADASILLALLEAGHRVAAVDAVDGGGPPGTVMQLDPDALVGGPIPLSSHGIGVAEAIALARTLYGDAAISRLAIVGIAIARPATHAVGCRRRSPPRSASPPRWSPSWPALSVATVRDAGE